MVIKPTQFVRRRGGFTIIELSVAIGVLVILSAVTITNFVESKRRARDTRRREDVAAIKASLDLYRVSHASYFVTVPDKNCGYTAPPDIYTVGTGNGDGCVGANGLSFGKVNLKNASTAGYNGHPGRSYPADPGNQNAKTIMEALQAGGYISTIPRDPLSAAGVANDPSARDYILVRCCSAGKQNVARGGVFVGVWTALESAPTTIEADNSSRFCGGAGSQPDGIAGYRYDFGAQPAEQTLFESRGYSVGNAAPKAPESAKATGDCGDALALDTLRNIE